MSHLDLLAEELYGGRRRLLWLRCARTLALGKDSRRALALVRLSQHFHARRHRFASRLVQRRLQSDFGCFINREAQIGKGLKLPHPVGVVIGSGARLGENCTVYHQVTLGGARVGDWQAGRYPSVGENVVLFAGAKVLGAISIGDGAQIGANAVVTKDVPAGHSAMGIPARSRPIRPEALMEVTAPEGHIPSAQDEAEFGLVKMAKTGSSGLPAQSADLPLEQPFPD